MFGKFKIDSKLCCLGQNMLDKFIMGVKRLKLVESGPTFTVGEHSSDLQSISIRCSMTDKKCINYHFLKHKIQVVELYDDLVKTFTMLIELHFFHV